jgi:hypothetical protein
MMGVIKRIALDRHRRKKALSKERVVNSSKSRPISDAYSDNGNALAKEVGIVMDDRSAIIKAIKHFSPEKARGWSVLESSLDQVKFVAFDPLETSIGITPSGRFSVLANVLMSVNSKGFGGKLIRSSITIPAVVDGAMTGDRANIESVQIRFNDADVASLLPADASMSTAIYHNAAE